MKTKHALKALSALAQESRLAVFKLLVKHGKEGLSAGEISTKLEIPAPTLSFHLSHLANADLVTSQKNGRVITYSANFECMQGLLSYLLERCSEMTLETVAKKQKKKSQKAQQATVTNEAEELSTSTNLVQTTDTAIL